MIYIMTILSRRNFMKVTTAAGCGLILSFAILPNKESRQTASTSLSAFIQINEDGTVTIKAPKMEMGQGAYTAIPVIIAEELGVKWAQVRIEQAPANREAFGSQAVGGSTSIRSNFQRYREAGATVRSLLTQAAAKEWQVPIEECLAADGQISHRKSNRSLNFVDLAAKAADLPIPEKVELKSVKDFQLIGKNYPKADAHSIVTAQAVYASDEYLEDMVYASVVRCPYFGGSVKSFDADQAKAIKGVIEVFEIEGIGGAAHVRAGVVIIADSTWAAMQAKEALEVRWYKGDFSGQRSVDISEEMRQQAADWSGKTVFERGKTAVLNEEKALVEASYEQPFLSQSPLEPPSCIAKADKESCELWIGTQNPNWAKFTIAETLKIPAEKVTIHPYLVGGGFGRKINPDYALEAALIAQKSGKTVKVIWTRIDDTHHGFYRPATLIKLKAYTNATDPADLSWDCFISSTSVNSTYGGYDDDKVHGGELYSGLDGKTIYDIANMKVTFNYVKTAVTMGFWRAVAMTYNVYAIESFIDEIAHALKIDSFDYRIQLLDRAIVNGYGAENSINPKRAKACLELLDQKIDWKNPPEGRFYGLACCYVVQSYMAIAVELSLDEQKQPKVERVVSVVDAGIIINPDGFIAQIEGGNVFGLSIATKEEITIHDNRIMQNSYKDYAVLRMNECPPMETYLIESTEAPGGAGELSTPPFPAAYCNALFAATGKRYRNLPVKT